MTPEEMFEEWLYSEEPFLTPYKSHYKLAKAAFLAGMEAQRGLMIDNWQKVANGERERA